MKPFNLSDAKAGAPIVTQGGDSARLVAHIPDANESCRVVFMRDGSSTPHMCGEDGRFVSPEQSSLDLFMAERKTTYWVNLYAHPAIGICKEVFCYATRDEADHHGGYNRIGGQAWPLEITE